VRRLLTLAFVVWAATRPSAQIQYAAGQNVAPVFEGWLREADGTILMWFGYLNRNYEEEVNIPIGPSNTIEPGDDRNQPTHFYPRRQLFVFNVRLPMDWDKNGRVTWTLTSHGRTDVANGWLQPEWELSPQVITFNRTQEIPQENNRPPTITVDPPTAVTKSNRLILTVSATDDGFPKPRKQRSGAPANTDRAANPDPVPLFGYPPEPGLRIKWIQYRGPGKVVFDPDQTSPVYGQPLTVTTTASFGVPGTYVLRAIVSDGELESTRDVTVDARGAGVEK
jgi:hypothetical protein